jgi:cystathionine gamma-synthase
MTRGLGTILVQDGRVGAGGNQPAAMPLYASSGWEFASLAQADEVFTAALAGASYGNRGTPNHLGVERVVAALEGAESAVSLTSGMAAVSSVLFALLKPGDRIVASYDVFGVTSALLRDVERWGVTVTRVDATDLDDVERAVRAGTRLIYVESMSNPLLRVPDLRALVAIASRAEALVVVDNTIASPIHCQPVQLGAHLSIESATKVMAGHHDVILGFVAGSATLVEGIEAFADRAGLRPSAFDAWLGARGLQTLSLRQERCAATADRVARWLEAQPGVRAVHYPGLSSHPDHGVASRQFVRGFGGTVTLELTPNMTAVNAFVSALRMITLVHSLGGPRTTVSHAATMTHRALSPSERARRGLHDGVIRLAVGLEDAQDVIDDLARGLTAIDEEELVAGS